SSKTRRNSAESVPGGPMTQLDLKTTPLTDAARRFLEPGVYGHFIDGRETLSASGETFAVIDPNTGLTFARCALGGPEEIDAAARAARAAFEDGRWRHMPAQEKERILRRFAELIEANRDLLFDLDVIDGGVVRSYST